MYQIILQSIYYVLLFMQALILIRAIVSWLRLQPDSPIVRILRFLTDPILLPVSKLLEKSILGTGIRLGIDISPLIALILLQVISRYIGMQLYFWAG